jgi:hypothetical protein
MDAVEAIEVLANPTEGKEIRQDESLEVISLDNEGLFQNWGQIMP